MVSHCLQLPICFATNTSWETLTRTARHAEAKAQAITCKTEEAVRELHASLGWWEFRLGTDFVEERVGQYLKSARQSCDAHS